MRALLFPALKHTGIFISSHTICIASALGVGSAAGLASFIMSPVVSLVAAMVGAGSTVLAWRICHRPKAPYVDEQKKLRSRLKSCCIDRAPEKTGLKNVARFILPHIASACIGISLTGPVHGRFLAPGRSLSFTYDGNTLEPTIFLPQSRDNVFLNRVDICGTSYMNVYVPVQESTAMQSIIRHFDKGGQISTLSLNGVPFRLVTGNERQQKLNAYQEACREATRTDAPIFAVERARLIEHQGQEIITGSAGPTAQGSTLLDQTLKLVQTAKVLPGYFESEPGQPVPSSNAPVSFLQRKSAQTRQPAR